MANAGNKQWTATYAFGVWTNGEAVFDDDDLVSLQCLITDFEEEGTAAAIDGAALCDDTEVNSLGRKGGTASFTAHVPIGSTGRTFKDKEGLPIKMVIKETTAMSVGRPITGMVTSVRHTVANNALQLEAVQIRKYVPVAA